MKNKLYEYIRQYSNQDIAVAFSGGVDSSVVLKAACDCAKENDMKVYAVMANTSLHPVGEVECARSLAVQMGAEFVVIQVDELKDAGIEYNPKNRCYLCKRCIFSKIKSIMADRGVTTILEGTNEDDLHVYRPGLQAIRELNIISPLAQLGITKSQVRSLANEMKISVANKPSAPCLATRLPYGTKIDSEVLQRIDQCENYLRDMGFCNVRIRLHSDIARIEVDRADVPKLAEISEQVCNRLKMAGFKYITLDLEGFRSGSMDL